METYKDLILEVLRDKSFFSTLLIEIFKALVTFGFGYLSFKIFQRFKNKKETNKLYISLIKLEKELLKNKNIVQAVINEYISLEILLDMFNIDKKYSQKLDKLYKDISYLSSYTYMDFERDGNGEIVDCIEIYADKPYTLIEEISGAIAYCEDDYDIENMEKQLEYYKNQDIYTDFSRIYNEINELLEKEFPCKEALVFLKKKLEKYNSLKLQEKKMYLQKFCKIILEDKNIFTDSLEMYRDIQSKRIKLNSNEKIKLSFGLWDTIDVDILALYDAEAYIEIEDIYEKLNSLNININDRKSLEEACILIDKSLDHVNIHKKNIKKILTKNNRYFKYV